jgi:hypothetical protein
MIYLYNNPSDCIGMYLDYFNYYYAGDEEILSALLDRYKYISTKKPE